MEGRACIGRDEEDWGGTEAEEEEAATEGKAVDIESVRAACCVVGS